LVWATALVADDVPEREFLSGGVCGHDLRFGFSRSLDCAPTIDYRPVCGRAVILGPRSGRPGSGEVTLRVGSSACAAPNDEAFVAEVLIVGDLLRLLPNDNGRG
jgi:hypothetical protein